MSTICSARDDCWRGACLRPVFWWRHCWTAGPTVTWPKLRPPLSDWQPHRMVTIQLCATSGCSDCKRYWRGLTAMPRLTRTCGIATATWRERLATRGISPGPRQCHDRDGIGLLIVWHRAAAKREVLFGVRRGRVDSGE